MQTLSRPDTSAQTIHYTSKAIPPEVLEILSRAIVGLTNDGFRLDAEQMDRDSYDAFKKVILSIKGKWDGKTHVFEYDPSTVLTELISVGKFPEGNAYSLFETPDQTVQDLFDFMDLSISSDWYNPEYRFLEPSAGRGQIANAIKSRLPLSIIDTVEIDPFNQKILKNKGYDLIGYDWLKTEVKPIYDFVVMNPPFGGTEYIKHIKRGFEALRPGGRLGAIVPEGFMFYRSKVVKDFRNFVAERGYWEPIGSPFEYTKVKCLMLRMDKFDQEYLDSLWQPNSGYESTHQLNIEIALDSRYEWDQVKVRATKTDEHLRSMYLADQLDIHVNNLIQKENCCFVYDDKVKAQLLRSVLEDVANWE